ncbi:MAG: hypothetical protein UT13_C0001G0378 [Candidatus Pacebacteria bacterium GW2011_GWF2_38_9]|nr:MAG: hypothetical protein US01_C0001G0388 [candidate division TM6 bacterium GW2011_GWF2_28_16]KKQ08461.1 MAG: hypothetical protein US20_C0016G0006 [Candidatus Pacebacteria bacterium GW2011_GWF1_36_5]KKQ88731.1 MAG: hypothetical protein UT13_C0001G0378 [Candidatus Pacebacteria bacterium GW2011_GWF2_38_9]
MPNFDKTGPQGQGKLTGRGLGPCGQGKTKGMGRGMGFGGRCRGYGRGLGRYFGWNAPQTTEEKAEDLKAYKQSLQEELEDVEKELASVQ